MPTVLITGSNRGLGLEWCRQYVEAGWRVLATCRFPAEAKALQQLGNENNALTLHRLDVTNHDQIHRLAQELADHPIDLLINNAGVYFEKYVRPDQTTDYEAWSHTFSVNSIGAMFQLFFTPEKVRDEASAKRANADMFRKLFDELLKRDVFIPPSQFETCFVSYSHNEDDTDKTIEAYGEAIKRARG